MAVISPIFLSFHIEDLELFFKVDQDYNLTMNDVDFVILLFADNMVTFSKGRNDLKNSLYILRTYKEWGAEFNTGEIMVVLKKDSLIMDLTMVFIRKESI